MTALMKPKIIFEDDCLLFVDKPAGWVCERQGGVNTIADFFKDQINDPERSGIVHRLDKDTSGILVLGKDTQTRKQLQRLFAGRKVQKTYTALVNGRPEHSQAVIDLPIRRQPNQARRREVHPAGKAAQTSYDTLQEYKNSTLLRCQPRTGRTHQIRVHLAHIGHPIVGDSVYGTVEPRLGRQFLHASEITFTLAGQQYHEQSSLPADLQNYLDQLD